MKELNLINKIYSIRHKIKNNESIIHLNIKFEFEGRTGMS
jgi:hypothetical protein